MSDTNKIKCCIERERHVLRCDVGFYTFTFDAKSMTADELRRYCDKLQIFFLGYETDIRIPHIQPEVRQFLRHFHREWPYAAFFCDLSTHFLLIEAMAQMDYLEVLECAGTDRYWLRFSRKDFERYLVETRRILRAIGRRSGLSATEISDRIARVENYFQEQCGYR